jgi:hypothetical protein
MDTGCIKLLDSKMTKDVGRGGSINRVVDAHESLDLLNVVTSVVQAFIALHKKSILFFFDCIKISVFVLLFLFIHVKVNAQTLEEQRLRSKSPWNFLNDFTVDSNAQDVNAIDNSSGVTYTSGLRYALNPKQIFWAFGSGSKRFTGEERLDLLDTVLRFEQVLDQKLFTMSQRLRFDAVLPTNDFVHEQTSFMGAVVGQIRFTKALPYRMFLIWNNRLRWNFHDFRVSELGIPNIQTTAGTLLNLSFAATPKLQTSLGLGWSLARTYKSVLKDFYSIDINASYVLTKEWSMTGGWTTAGSPYTADGQNSNIKLFDERDTTFYFSFTHFM